MNNSPITLNHYAAPLEEQIRLAICNNDSILRIELYNLIAKAGSLYNKSAEKMDLNSCQFKAFRHTPIPNQLTAKTRRNDRETHNRLCKEAETPQEKRLDFLKTTITLYDLNSIKELEGKPETENADLFRALSEINQPVNSSNSRYAVESTEVLIEVNTHNGEKLEYWSTASRNITRLDTEVDSVWTLNTPTNCVWEQFTASGLIFDAMIKKPENRPYLINELEIRLKQIKPFYQGNQEIIILFMNALRNVLKIPSLN